MAPTPAYVSAYTSRYTLVHILCVYNSQEESKEDQDTKIATLFCPTLVNEDYVEQAYFLNIFKKLKP